MPGFSGQRSTPTKSSRCRCGARARRPSCVERNEAAVDDDDAAAGEPRRRKHPVAGAGNVGAEGGAGGVDQRLLAGEEFGGKGDAAEFVGLRPISRGQPRAAAAARAAREAARSASRSDFPSRPCGRAARCRARSGSQCRQARRPSARSTPPRCGASRVAPLLEPAFRRLVVILQRDQQALDRAAAAPASRSGSAAATAPRAPNKAADRATSVIERGEHHDEAADQDDEHRRPVAGIGEGKIEPATLAARAQASGSRGTAGPRRSAGSARAGRGRSADGRRRQPDRSCASSLQNKRAARCRRPL